MKKRIKDLAVTYYQEILEIRKHLHRYPELAFEEVKTAEYISEKLHEWDIPHATGYAQTGISGIIKSTGKDGPVIALRADMDGLPISEENTHDFVSQHKGIMHACGHDVHMASLLGTLRILNEIKHEFRGQVKFVFQPSEEKYPGGALEVIKEGFLENPVPDSMLGQHVLPALEAGKIGLRPGMYMASTDEIFITINGKGGHAATPELNIDPVAIGAQVITALQQISSSYAPSEIPTVLSFGKVEAPGRTNIIPDTFRMEGTFRTFSESWRKKAHQKIEEIATGIATSMGASCEVDIDKGYPFLVNDEEVTHKLKVLAIEYLGKENVADLNMRMTAEDFAYYSQKVPSCFYRLGIRNEEKGIVANLHTSTFDIDEKSLMTGMGVMAWIAFNQVK